MDYGTYEIPLYRVWNIKAKQFIYGLAGSRSSVRIKFHDFLCNEFCNGWNPQTFNNAIDGIDSEFTRESLLREYRKARRNYRIVKAKIRIADNLGQGMTAIVI